MKMMKKMQAVAILSCVAVFLISCPNPAGRDGAFTPRAGAVLSLSVATPEAASLAGARTLLPSGDLAIASYALSAAGPGSASFVTDFESDEVFSRNGLAAGTWTFTVNAEAADATVLYSGSAQSELVAGIQNDVRIALTPTAGNGIVNLVIHWPVGSLAEVQANFTILEKNGTLQNIVLSPLTVDSGSASYTGTLAVGSYLINMSLQSGATTRFSRTSVVQVLTNRTTDFDLTLSMSDINSIDPPIVTPLGGGYVAPLNLTISAESGALIYYSTDGTDPLGSTGIHYSGPLSLIADVTIKTRAVRDGVLASSTVVESYSITILNPTSTPIFSPAGGTFMTNQSVTMSSSTSGATIYYTVDGSIPTTESIKYSGTPITAVVYPSTMVRAIAIAPGFLQSEDATAIYDKVFTIGSTGPAGGLVFYDKGSYSEGWRYLEAALSDQSSGIIWWNASVGGVMTYASATTIGSGESNTATIVSVQGPGSYAASLCADLNLGGYDDWFLPSRDELNALYVQKGVIGGFTSAYYWSSSEYDRFYAWWQNFDNGGQGILSMKDSYNRVRAIRSF